ncbi:MAG TPA: cytochrome c biogenesis protein CcdA [Longimicrobiales bacterium]|nr:cytochrome c biogenesis protein CcdA [Longimicrobiales bacterium]
MAPEALGLSVAFVAGVLSFLSPCVLPLVPSYASFLTGMTFDELLEGRRARGPLLIHGVLFVLGFSLVFIALGASASALGGIVRREGFWLTRAGGVILILFGLHLMGLVRLPGAHREHRMHLARRPAGYAGSMTVGVAFGAGWTPCIGPVLGGILTLAATRGGVVDGVRLLGVYAAGLAVPFLLSTLVLDRFLGVFRRFRRWLPWVNRVSGALLVVMGMLLVSGSFTLLAGYLTRLTPDFLLQRL